MVLQENKGSNMKFKAIIFDMDGTIIDTEKIWKEATRSVITSKGVEISPELEAQLAHELRGVALHKSCAVIKEMFSLAHEVEDLVKEKRDKADALYAIHVKFIDGFIDFHKRVQATGLVYGIATNADDNNIETTINKLKLRDYFGEHIYGISKVNYKGKPAPDIYLHVAKQLGIDPSLCVAIEDTSHGIESAQKAGMFCIGINSAGNRKALEKADFIIDHYSEIDLKRLLKK